MVLVDSQWFSVVLRVSSRRIPMVLSGSVYLTGSRRFSVVLVGSQCSRRFSMVISGSCRFSMFLNASC